MKFLSRFCLGLLVTILCDISVFSIFEKKPTEKWEPYEEGNIKNQNEAEVKRTEAEERIKKAEEQEKTARKDKERKKAQLNLEQAKRDLNTVEMASAKIGLEDQNLSAEKKGQEQKKLQSAEIDRQATDIRIRYFDKNYTPPPKGLKSSEFKKFYDTLEFSISLAQSNPELAVIGAFGDIVDTKYKIDFSKKSKKDIEKAYTKQREALVQLHDIATNQKGEWVQEQAQKIAERISEIDTFLTPADKQRRDSVAQQTSQNKVATRLQLEDKIVSDQVSSLQQENVFMLNKLDKSLEEGMKPEELKQESFKEKLELLSEKGREKLQDEFEQLKGAMDAYGVSDEEGPLAVFADDVIQEFNPKLELQVNISPKVVEVLEKSQKLLEDGVNLAMSSDDFVEKNFIQAAAGKVAKAIQLSADYIVRGAKKVLYGTKDFFKGMYDKFFVKVSDTGEMLQESAAKMKGLVEGLQKAPEITGDVLAVLQKANKIPLDTFAKLIGATDSTKRQYWADDIRTVKEVFDALQAQGTDVANIAVQISDSRFLKALTRLADVSDRVGGWLKDKATVAIELGRPEVIEQELTSAEKADRFIEEYKSNPLSQKRLDKAKNKLSSVKETMGKIGDTITRKAQRRQDAVLSKTKDYETKRSGYLELIGIGQAPEKPKEGVTPEQVSVWELKTSEWNEKFDSQFNKARAADRAFILDNAPQEYKKKIEKTEEGSKAEKKVIDDYRKTVQTKTRDLGVAEKDLMFAATDLENYLDGVIKNLDFLVNAWDFLPIDKRESIADTVNTIVEVFNTRLALISEVRKQLGELSKAGATVKKTSIKGEVDIATVFLERLRSTLTGAMAKALTENLEQITALGKKVKEGKKTLSDAIKASKKESPIDEPG